MVQLMNSRKVSPESDSLRRKTVSVKLEVGDEDGPLTKRSKVSSSSQNDLGTGAFPVPPSQYNPLAEPSPLGLRLKKSPSLLDLIQMKISQGNASKFGTSAKKENKSNTASGNTDKLKASNFPASFLRIGTWEYKSRYEGDLVAKCYFAKHKLVWEVLDGGLKNKIEIQWSDIMALKANYPDDEPGTLDVALARQPLFFRETNPQPRKHTLWQATSDFTDGQASIHRRHFLQCPPGFLGKHFEKLVQCDPRLNFLCQQAEIVLESPYFDPKLSVFDDSNELNDGFELNNDEPELFDLRNSASPSGAQSSTSKNEQQDLIGRPPEHFPRETPSPSSVMDTHAIEGIRRSKAGESKNLSNEDPIKLLGLHPSMSMTDLLSQIENRLTDRTSFSFTLSSEERKSLETLEDIRRCLFSDSQQASTSDEQSIMSRVNSLCCLVQKDPMAFENLQAKGDDDCDRMVEKRVDAHKVAEEDSPAPAMSRKDSVGELLLNLPRIASLPQFFFNISEDFNNQAR